MTTGPEQPRSESMWPVQLGVAVAVLAVLFALVAKSGWRPGRAAESLSGGLDEFNGRLTALCLRADGTATLLAETRACATSSVIELRLDTLDTRVTSGGWVLFGHGEVGASAWDFGGPSSVRIPLATMPPGPRALMALFSDRPIDMQNFYEYVVLAGTDPDDTVNQLEQAEKRINKLRRGGQLVGVKTLVFRVERG